MYNSGALISGAAALKIISGKDFEPSDIDFVVSSTCADILHFYLLGRRYLLSMSFTAGQSDEGYASILVPGTVVRRYAYRNRSVDVSITPVSSLHMILPTILSLVSSQLVIMSYHSSVVMNAIGWEGNTPSVMLSSIGPCNHADGKRLH